MMQATDIMIHAHETQRIKQTLNSILAKHTKKSLEQITQDTERDNFMTAQEAFEYGLVDKVITDRTQMKDSKE